MKEIRSVILAGGSGKRLWPLSRKTYPKQFSKLFGEMTLFQATAKRLCSSDIVKFLPHITITTTDFRFIVSDQLQEIGVNSGPILIEPESKNTAAAILASSLFAYSDDKDAVLLCAPSDHMIADFRRFHEAIVAGMSSVKQGKIIAFGVKPTRPEINYGYLEVEKNVAGNLIEAPVLSFVEKPNLETAEQMVAQGNFVWNTGILMFRAHDLINAFDCYAPETLALVKDAVKRSSIDLGFHRLSAEPWLMLDNVSIESAIVEKAQNLVSILYTSKWSDLGGWGEVWRESDPDPYGNVTSPNGHAIDCTNSLLRSESSSQQVVGLGLDDIMAVAMPDAVLVAHRQRSQDIKKAVKLLSSKSIVQAEIFPEDHRPWGWFESLVLGDRFQVKRICVKPGAALSLQSHNHRSEHWIVVEGTAKVTIDGKINFLSEGESIYVPLKAKHRMENPNKMPVLLIEVQIGEYLGEDDIIRYEDLYARL